MKIINANRQGGKTTKAIELAKESGAYLVVANDSQRHNLIAKYPEMESKLITFNQVLHTLAGISDPCVVIDNADDFLRYVLRGIRIEAITIDGQVEGPAPMHKNVDVYDPKRQYKREDYVKFVSKDDPKHGALHLVTTNPPDCPLVVGIDTAFCYCW